MKSKNAASSLAPKLKNALVVFLLLQTGVAMANFETSTSLMGEAPGIANSIARVSAGSVIALNRSLSLNGATLAAGSELIVGADGKLSLVSAPTDSAEAEDIFETGASVNELSSSDYTLLQVNEQTGEIESYNLPGDFQVAGPGGHRRKRSGVTNCYHVVKALVRHRVSLSGVAAYMAAPQLQRAGWHRYANYDAAPVGSVCVFAAGGIVTPSGGHRYGHVGVKGAGGIANPTSGFHLKRPFLGCWNER